MPAHRGPTTTMMDLIPGARLRSMKISTAPRLQLDSIKFGNGDYTTTSFMLTSDGSGGILIADPATSGSGTVIDAGNGGNTLTGTAGSDTFVFKAITDSQPGAGNFDTITNFTHNSDHIDLTAIAGANAVQGLVDAASTVDAHSISWFVDSANNQTIVYVNYYRYREPRGHGNPPHRHEHQPERKRHPSSYVAAIDRAAVGCFEPKLQQPDKSLRNGH